MKLQNIKQNDQTYLEPKTWDERSAVKNKWKIQPLIDPHIKSKAYTYFYKQETRKMEGYINY
jgi:hypothetical protein